MNPSIRLLIAFCLIGGISSYLYNGLPMAYNMPYYDYFDPRFIFGMNKIGMLQSLGSSLGSLFGRTTTCTVTRTRKGHVFELGTCQDYISCLSTGQQVGGFCTAGFKACCIPRTKTITNPSPVASRTYTIKPISRDYCQVRLDFTTFVIEQPSNGTCTTGKLTFSGERDTNNVPVTCGTLSGQHTPVNCLQYYQTSSGDVRSFNYMNCDSTNVNNYHLNNMNYKICIDTSLGSSVKWTKPTDASDYFFTVSGNVSALIEAGVEDQIGTDTLVTILNCTDDYVIIDGGKYTDTTGTSVSSDRYCGFSFPSSGVTTSVSLELTFVTNDNENPDVGNCGFYLHYAVS